MKPITKAQIRAVHILLAKTGMTDTDYRLLLRNRFDVASSKDLDSTEAHQLIVQLAGGREVSKKRIRKPIKQPALASASAYSGNLIRMVTPQQRKLIDALQKEINWYQPEGYLTWLQKSLGLSAVRTKEEAQKTINGLKGLKSHGHAQKY